MDKVGHYTYKETFDTTLKYFDGDELATKVWMNKYSLKEMGDGNDDIEKAIFYEKSPEDMFHRLTNELHRVGLKYKNPLSKDEIYNLIKDFKYIVLQGRPMAGIGNDNYLTSLSNCFVVGHPDEDSYGSIFRTDQEIGQLEKRGGGVGTDLSHFRASGSKVRNAAQTSTGPVEICANRFSNTTREVGQSGRRGALMLSMDIDHKNAEEFMDSKLDNSKITGANISLKINNAWLKSFIDNIDPNKENERLWKKIIYNAWKSAEPGVLFWDTIINESVADCYGDFGFKTISTNPCVVGDTKVAVADGRNYVSIKELADEGDDVPVYTSDRDGNLVIETMRNPRITGYNQQIYRVNIEGGHSLRVTGNHKFILKDGSEVEAKDLKRGDSLKIMTKSRANYHDIITNSTSGTQDYYFLNTSDKRQLIGEHRIIANSFETGNVVHHIDYNGLNNDPNNLQIMTKEEHDKFHSEDMLGEKNPYHQMSDEWKFNFASKPGEVNPTFKDGITNDIIKEHALKLSKALNRRFSKKDWIKYAEENNLPQSFSEYRRKELGTPIALAKWAANKLGLDNIDVDPRLAKTYESALKNGYEAEIVGNEVLVSKTCEHCSDEFQIGYHQREIAFCSHNCSLIYVNTDKTIKTKRTNAVNEAYSKRSSETKEKQLKIYSQLKFELGREPLLKEWEHECKTNDISFRLGTKHGFKKFSEIKGEAQYYNHKVVSIELDGVEDVYNGTVDNFHTFYMGGFEETNKYGKPMYISVLTKNCGEIPLSVYDSCRLMLLNLNSYVEKRFTKDAYLNWDLLADHARKITKIMDNMIDLEIEKINNILSKIKDDPESVETKEIEINLWEKIKHFSKLGRRAGIGITGEGDMLASLGLIYGTKEATDMAEAVHKLISTNVYIESCDLVQRDDRPQFEVFNSKLEESNPFINRLISQNDEYSMELKRKIKKGRRNIALLTIAPAGSVSIMTKTTSGIEPVFKPFYDRKRKIEKNGSETPDFIDETGDWFKTHNVIHHNYIVWYSIYKGVTYNEASEELSNMKEDKLLKIYEKSPYYKATSSDVNWVEKVNMQGRVQKWIDHSISATTNIPEDTSVDVVRDIYETAWRSGCKGMTIYREGSRDGVLTSTIKEVKVESPSLEIKRRPKVLPAKVVRFNNNGEKWVSVIGLLEDKPYEIFTGRLSELNIPKYVEDGVIIKNREIVLEVDELNNEVENNKSRYDFQYENKNNEDILVYGLSKVFNEEYWDYAKLISGLLRHNMAIEYVVKVISTLRLGGDNIGTWKNGVIRALRKFMKSDINTGEKCPMCKGSNMVNDSGCTTCMDCGYSKCN